MTPSTTSSMGFSGKAGAFVRTLLYVVRFGEG